MATAMASASAISRNTQPNVATPTNDPMTLSSIARRLAGAAWLAALAGCATPPPAPVVPVPSALACPPVEKPACPAPAATTPAPTPLPETRGRLKPGAWQDLPDWRREPVKPALEAFLRSCGVLEKADPWKPACAGARALPASAGEAEVAAYFESAFDPHQVLNPDDSPTGMVTGYYEPLLRGSRSRSARYRYPLYAPPQDMLTIDLGSLHPDLRNRRLRGRIDGNRVVPYLARGDIEREPSPLRGLEIAWAEDPVEVFFLHIQGSGQVELESGERLRVGYADQNGHPFKSLGRLLIDRGELAADKASMQGIKDWARRNPAKTQEFLNANPSYVFFRELPRHLPGPLGALGVPLTPERSVAVDPRVVPLGAPVYLSTTWPNAVDPLQRLMVAQDTGGAITGAVRVDFFWGFGDAAGALAGRMRQGGRMWVLLPKGHTPPAS
jgi:membrane-bound lytic murein transglycosylase A